MVWLRGASTLVALLTGLVAGDGSKAATKAAPTADLISQEVEQLEALKKLCSDRIELLEDLKQTVNSGVNVSIPEKHVLMLQKQFPLMSEITMVDEQTAPTGSADDYLFSKAVIRSEEPVSLMKFLPLRSPSSSGSSVLPSALVVTYQQSDGRIRLYTPDGDLVLTFLAGHEQPVTHLVTSLATASSNQESFITTADAEGDIRVHKVEMRLRRVQKKEKGNRSVTPDPTIEKASQYLTSQLNVTHQFVMQMRVPSDSNGEPARITAVAVASQQGTRYFVAGDAEGKVTVFSRNGTEIATIDAAVTAGAKVEALYPHLGSLLFHVGFEWGFVNFDKMEVMHMDCPEFEGRISSAVIDSQKATRVLIANEEGVVYAFNTKEKKKCKIEHQFAKGISAPQLELNSMNGFALALERTSRGHAASALAALNMSHLGRREDSLVSPVAWRKHLAPLRDWAFHKRHQQGDLLAFLSDDGLEIEIMELLNMHVYTPPKEDSFSNFQTPVIGVAVVLVLGYQYVKNKGKFSGSSGGKNSDKFNLDSADLASLTASLKKNKAKGEGTAKPRSE